MSESQRTEEATHWLLVDEASMASKHELDRGWRLHVSLDDFDAYVELAEEQTFPERVHRADANHLRATNGTIRLRADEVKWLRDRLDEILPELERRNGVASEDPGHAYACNAKEPK